MKIPPQTQFVWLAGCAVLLFILSLAFAHLPAPFRRVVLFFAAYGVLSGVVLKWWTRERGVLLSPVHLVLIGILIFVGGVHVSWASFEQFAKTRGDLKKENSEQIAMLNMLEGMADAESKAEYNKLRREFEPDYFDYLTFRVSRMGAWGAPWPLLFWLGELTIATTAGILILSQNKEQAFLAQPDENIPLKKADS